MTRNVSPATPASPKLQVYTLADLEKNAIPEVASLPEDFRFAMRVVAHVLPFRVNRYVVENLIDWNSVPEDPLFQLTFPQPGMLSEEDFNRVASLLKSGATRSRLQQEVHEIRLKLNPHPAGQRELNLPLDEEGRPINGLQHKYRETVLFFPSQGQTCHSYCSFCFRWAQFVGEPELKIASREAAALHGYLRRHKEVTDLLITGGDPMVMRTKHWKSYLEPLLAPEFDHVQNIRIGTKALTYWPHRFVTEPDADEFLRLLERLVQAGKNVALMAHYNHPREFEPEIAREAIRRVHTTGAVIRTQAPLLRHINDDPKVWSEMWRGQVKLGMVPYYMFVERDTGARNYFEVPLYRCWEIYREAAKSVSGLSRTVRGPSMSAEPGKVEILGVSEINGEKVFVLRFLQGRNSDWCYRPFFARFDEKATWLTDLKPAFGEAQFFFEPEMEEIRCQRLGMAS